MNHENNILQAIKHIVAQNQTPNVAKVKAHLTSNAPLPIIISVLKSWQHNPSIVEQLAKQPLAPATPEDDKTEQMIQAAIAPLAEEIKQLRLLITQLLAHQQKE